jgi:hypothetical protein
MIYVFPSHEGDACFMFIMLCGVLSRNLVNALRANTCQPVNENPSRIYPSKKKAACGMQTANNRMCFKPL